MDNSQTIQEMEKSLAQEFAGVVPQESPKEEPVHTPEVKPSEGTKEEGVEQDSSTNESPIVDRIEKLEEQRKRMLATKSKDEKEKSVLKAELEDARKALEEASASIRKFKDLPADERTADTDIDFIDAVATKKVAQRDISRIEKEEQLSFYRNNNELSAEELDSIESIKKEIPNLSWERAKTFYFAEHNPSVLIEKKVNTKKLGIDGITPSLNEKKISLKDMDLKSIEKELSKMDISFQ